MENVYYIYVLFKPWNLEPFYVGKGKQNRINAHFKFGLNHYNKHVANIFAKAGDREVPSVILHDNLDERTAFEYEKAFIAAIGRDDLGFGPLANLTDGGEGQSNPSEETRRKIGAAQLGRVHTEEHKAKVRKKTGPRGYGWTEEQKARVRGRPKSHEHKAALKAAGNKPETRQRLSEINKGRTRSEESKKRQSEAMRGKPGPMLGVPMSEESKRKLSESQKIRIAKRKEQKLNEKIASSC